MNIIQSVSYQSRFCSFQISFELYGSTTLVPIHNCDQWLCPHTFVPIHVCPQARLCPHTFVHRNVRARHICSQTRLCPDMLVRRQVCTQTCSTQLHKTYCAQTRLSLDAIVPSLLQSLVGNVQHIMFIVCQFPVSICLWILTLKHNCLFVKKKLGSCISYFLI